MRRHVLYLVIAIVGGVVAVFVLRETLGSTRPDLVSWVSFDDGPFAFAKTFSDGRVGPFTVGQSRSQAAKNASQMAILDQDREQLRESSPQWRISIAASSGGYVTYTLNFEDDQVTDVRVYYAVFAGL